MFVNLARLLRSPGLQGVLSPSPSPSPWFAPGQIREKLTSAIGQEREQKKKQATMLALVDALGDVSAWTCTTGQLGKVPMEGHKHTRPKGRGSTAP
jgi:hypothetical protein